MVKLLVVVTNVMLEKIIYEDVCLKNFIIEHKMEPSEYKKDIIIMKCKYCGKTCEVKKWLIIK